MKKAFLLPLGLIALLTLPAFIDPPGSLVGRWQKQIANVGLATVNYRPDSTYDSFVNGKSFISGRYAVSGDTCRMADGCCNMAYWGMHRLNFFQDSVQFLVLQDTCRRRSSSKNGNGLTMGRIGKP